MTASKAIRSTTVVEDPTQRLRVNVVLKLNLINSKNYSMHWAVGMFVVNDATGVLDNQNVTGKQTNDSIGSSESNLKVEDEVSIAKVGFFK